MSTTIKAVTAAAKKRAVATALKRSATTGVRINSGQRRAIVESARPSAGSLRVS